MRCEFMEAHPGLVDRLSRPSPVKIAKRAPATLEFGNTGTIIDHDCAFFT